jgi:hypothetical protein
MPLDFQQVQARVHEIGAGAAGRRLTLEATQVQARALLDTHAHRLDELRGKVESARAIDPNLRCALPATEFLTSSHPLTGIPIAVTLVAADGSQIKPDRHAPLEFCVVNLGAITLKMKSGQTPGIFTRTDLYFGVEIETEKLTSESAVSLRRDLDERLFAEEICRDLDGPVFNLIDGTLEIWGAKDGDDPKAYERAVSSHITILSRLQASGIPTAGYVDKPKANLVVRLLELASPFPEKLDELRNHHPLQGVSDLWLFGTGNRDFHLLKPGERSAVFQLLSGSAKYYQGDLALHFFYLNVGDREQDPKIARVEIPAWVARDLSKLDLIHGILIEQCRQMGPRPYPYVLTRAHEIAVVSQQEKDQLEMMLAIELRMRGEGVGDLSNKQAGKVALAAGKKSYS